MSRMCAARCRSVNRLDTVTAAYIAGLIEGEGTITLTRVHRAENRRLVLSISNNERTLLEFVATATGVGRITNKRLRNPRHKPSFAYQAFSRQAIGLFRQIEPYLKSYESQRCRLALRLYVALTPRNGKYPTNCLEARRAFEARLLSIRP